MHVVAVIVNRLNFAQLAECFFQNMYTDVQAVTPALGRSRQKGQIDVQGPPGLQGEFEVIWE